MYASFLQKLALCLGPEVKDTRIHRLPPHLFIYPGEKTVPGRMAHIPTDNPGHASGKLGSR